MKLGQRFIHAADGELIGFTDRAAMASRFRYRRLGPTWDVLVIGTSKKMLTLLRIKTCLTEVL